MVGAYKSCMQISDLGEPRFRLSGSWSASRCAWQSNTAMSIECHRQLTTNLKPCQSTKAKYGATYLACDLRAELARHPCPGLPHARRPADATHAHARTVRVPGHRDARFGRVQPCTLRGSTGGLRSRCLCEPPAPPACVQNDWACPPTPQFALSLQSRTLSKIGTTSPFLTILHRCMYILMR